MDSLRPVLDGNSATNYYTRGKMVGIIRQNHQLSNQRLMNTSVEIDAVKKDITEASSQLSSLLEKI